MSARTSFCIMLTDSRLDIELKCGKAPGGCGIYAEMLREGEAAALLWLHTLWCSTWNKGIIPLFDLEHGNHPDRLETGRCHSVFSVEVCWGKNTSLTYASINWEVVRYGVITAYSTLCTRIQAGYQVDEL